MRLHVHGQAGVHNYAGRFHGVGVGGIDPQGVQREPATAAGGSPRPPHYARFSVKFFAKFFHKTLTETDLCVRRRKERRVERGRERKEETTGAAKVITPSRLQVTRKVQRGVEMRMSVKFFTSPPPFTPGFSRRLSIFHLPQAPD